MASSEEKGDEDIEGVEFLNPGPHRHKYMFVSIARPLPEKILRSDLTGTKDDAVEGKKRDLWCKIEQPSMGYIRRSCSTKKVEGKRELCRWVGGQEKKWRECKR